MTPTKARKLLDELVTAASEHGEARTLLLEANSANAQAETPVHSVADIAQLTRREEMSRQRLFAFKHAVLIVLEDDEGEVLPL